MQDMSVFEQAMRVNYLGTVATIKVVAGMLPWV
jgi:hypothetical protein